METRPIRFPTLVLYCDRTSTYGRVVYNYASPFSESEKAGSRDPHRRVDCRATVDSTVVVAGSLQRCCQDWPFPRVCRLVVPTTSGFGLGYSCGESRSECAVLVPAVQHLPNLAYERDASSTTCRPNSVCRTRARDRSRILWSTTPEPTDTRERPVVQACRIRITTNIIFNFNILTATLFYPGTKEGSEDSSKV